MKQWWSYPLGRTVMPERGDDGRMRCPETGSLEVVEFNHVVENMDEMIQPNWPALFLLDPHPRKPHMFLWVVVDPSDDLWVVAEGSEEGDPADVAKHVVATERVLGINTVMRIMDPNMGRSPASARRGITWQDEFEEARLPCELADDSDVGRARINEYLKPDRGTMRPRLHVHGRCRETIFQLKRYVWDEYRRTTDRDVKQAPKPKYDDYPTLLRYALNSEPQFSVLHRGAPVLKRGGQRGGAY
jgi:hypothetical protein